MSRETDLHDQASLASSVVASLEDGVIAVGPGGRVVLANQRAADILGIPYADLFERPRWWEHVTATREDGAPLFGPGGAGSQVLADGAAVRDVMVRLRRADGRWMWLSVNFAALAVPGGGVVVSLRDVTVRRKAVERSERLFEATPIGMALVGLDGRFVRVNPRLGDLVGRRADEVAGRAWAEVLHPDDRAAAAACLAGAVAGGEVPEQLEQRLLCSDGTVVDVLTTLAVVREADGSPEYAVLQCLDVSERRRYQGELERRALHDPLTGLPNRVLLGDRLRHALKRLERSGSAIGLAFLDLDEFKRVNDSLGHSAGDEVLVETARRLERVMREGDTICRFGGDEFVVLCEDLEADRADAAGVRLGRRLIDEIEGAPYDVGEQSLHLHASVGIAVAQPGSAVSADRLLAESDAAMYRAKRRGGARPALARDETSFATHRLALESDLRAALDTREGLWLAYQPIVDVVTRRMVGLEALLRWHRPGHGPVSPAEVIPVAEESGLIVELGDWVLHQAVADVTRWPRGSGPYVAVNLGARQFGDAALVDTLRSCLEDHDVEPGRISLEITESVAMSDAETALGTMRALKDVGVRIAIDDFGTGFSSLGYLKRFPADTVKIDRAFVADVADESEDRAIVSAVLSMARALELDVVAEGVETEAQRAALAELGCSRAQGFLFARPAPLEDAVAAAR